MYDVATHLKCVTKWLPGGVNPRRSNSDLLRRGGSTSPGQMFNCCCEGGVDPPRARNANCCCCGGGRPFSKVLIGGVRGNVNVFLHISFGGPSTGNSCCYPPLVGMYVFFQPASASEVGHVSLACLQLLRFVLRKYDQELGLRFLACHQLERYAL